MTRPRCNRCRVGYLELKSRLFALVAVVCLCLALAFAIAAALRAL